MTIPNLDGKNDDDNNGEVQYIEDEFKTEMEDEEEEEEYQEETEQENNSEPIMEDINFMSNEQRESVL